MFGPFRFTAGVALSLVCCLKASTLPPPSSGGSPSLLDGSVYCSCAPTSDKCVKVPPPLSPPCHLRNLCAEGDMSAFQQSLELYLPSYPCLANKEALGGWLLLTLLSGSHDLLHYLLSRYPARVGQALQAPFLGKASLHAPLVVGGAVKVPVLPSASSLLHLPAENEADCRAWVVWDVLKDCVLCYYQALLRQVVLTEQAETTLVGVITELAPLVLQQLRLEESHKPLLQAYQKETGLCLPAPLQTIVYEYIGDSLPFLLPNLSSNLDFLGQLRMCVEVAASSLEEPLSSAIEDLCARQSPSIQRAYAQLLREQQELQMRCFAEAAGEIQDPVEGGRYIWRVRGVATVVGLLMVILLGAGIHQLTAPPQGHRWEQPACLEAGPAATFITFFTSSAVTIFCFRIFARWIEQMERRDSQWVKLLLHRRSLRRYGVAHLVG